jgi:hypothetical protein
MTPSFWEGRDQIENHAFPAVEGHINWTANSNSSDDL